MTTTINAIKTIATTIAGVAPELGGLERDPSGN
jgi:hypothetical protein